MRKLARQAMRIRATSRKRTSKLRRTGWCGQAIGRTRPKRKMKRRTTPCSLICCPRGRRMKARAAAFSSKIRRLFTFSRCRHLVRLASVTAEARHAKRPEHRHALAALVDRANAGAVLPGAGEVGVAVGIDVNRARHRHVGAEAIPAFGIRKANRAAAHHVDGGAHEDKGGLVGGRVVARLGGPDSEYLDAGSHNAVRV